MTKEIQQAQITDLPFPDCVRLRRGMYISNLNQYITEIVDNSVDEHFAGYCDTIAVVVQDGVVTIQDNREITIDYNQTLSIEENIRMIQDSINNIVNEIMESLSNEGIKL